MINVLHDGLALGRRRYTNARPVKRTVNWHGLPVSIEIEVGDVKSGIGDDGIGWSNEYTVPYGELPTTHALSDSDPVDCYLGSDENAPLVFVVHQLRSDGSFDEDKCFLNFTSVDAAVDAYKAHGPDFGYGSVDEMSVNEFIKGYLASNRVHG